MVTHTSCAGLGKVLGQLLSKNPDLLQTTAAARVLQLLMERESSAVLSAALQRMGLVEKLLRTNLDPTVINAGKPKSRDLKPSFLPASLLSTGNGKGRTLANVPWQRQEYRCIVK